MRARPRRTTACPFCNVDCLTPEEKRCGCPCHVTDSTDEGLNNPDSGIATMPGEDRRGV